MSERIVSPGVFTRERDLSFLPVGIGEIGAALIGPTKTGPSFVPTVVNSFNEFKNIFGDFDPDFYLPYTVNEYLRSAGSVTIVKVGYLGGYSAGSVNLVVSGANATAAAADFPNTVVATFAPSALNDSGLGAVSASIGGDAKASSFSISLAGTNATASLTGQAVIGGDGISGALFSDGITANPLTPTIGSTAATQYVYKNFQSSISASRAIGYIDADSPITVESQTSGLDFASGTTTVNDTTYVTTITGNKDAQAARTPFIQSQSPATNLFRIYTRIDGEASNGHYVVIRNIKRPQNSNVSSDFSQFSLDLFTSEGNNLESYNNLTLDPTNANYLPKVIGDQFQTVTSAGEVVTHGEYVNQSQFIRVGDYDDKTFEGTPALQPMGYAAVLEPIISTAAVPTASFNHAQVKSGDVGTYNSSIPYGFKINDANVNAFSDEEIKNCVMYFYEPL